ncbi:MAG: hypothetical protein KBT47_09220 [Armatimonadetes bacterium]|nr:hypothetical protein [Candidatus Hippobium faecium]
MKKIGIAILDYGQIIAAFMLLQYLRIRGLDVTELNDLGLVLASTSVMSISAGYMNRICHDWAGLTVVAIMIYTLVVILKMKFLVIGIPAALALICVFYFPSGMNMERLKANREKQDSEKKK